MKGHQDNSHCVTSKTENCSRLFLEGNYCGPGAGKINVGRITQLITTQLHGKRRMQFQAMVQSPVICYEKKEEI